MSELYDLNKLGPEAFENMVNFLALKILGSGAHGFGPGADGGRDGYFEGEADYPSEKNRWTGIWYIQSKFHKPHLSKDPQKWLIEQVKKEVAIFDDPATDRIWPNNWVLATNIDQSGKPETGSFDAIKRIIRKSPGGKKVNVAVWGGRKILDYLALNEQVAIHYGHFLTPGHVLSKLYEELSHEKTSLKELVNYFITTQFKEQTYTKLDQAGSSTDIRPNVQDLFIDLPFTTNDDINRHSVLASLFLASAQCHRYSIRKQYPSAWSDWNKDFRRARVSLLKGGPGQGKSTIGQYMCQIHRAKFILEDEEIQVIDSVKAIGSSVFEAATRDGFWPEFARIPIQIELKEYAHWHSQRSKNESSNVISYIAQTVEKRSGLEVKAKTIKNALAKRAWVVVFDGLDEVPSDYKDKVANEILAFLNELVIEIDADVFSICTSRPQGYSGQFSGLEGPVLNLAQLNVDQALQCATPLLKFGRSTSDAEVSINTLTQAIISPSIQELMTTPLQSHIMAVVVRDGGRPPERRWQLFNSFYLVMKKRESMKNFQNPRIAKLLREEDRLLKSVHTRLGFVLHAQAETSDGAQTTMKKSDFRELVRHVVTELDDFEVEATVSDVMEATTERLVLVSTPENGDEVRFDIRQLQEFFAAEFLYAGVDSDELSKRVEVIGGDAHWREVMHFLLSALVVNQRAADLAITIQTLRKLNEGNEFGVNSLYARRTAKAALLASRLVTEGVLEQDQRDRQQIRPLIEKIGGIYSVGRLTPLKNLGNSVRSRQWLVQTCFDIVSTASSSESSGAIYVLGWNIENNENLGFSVMESFLELPFHIQERLFALWTPRTIYRQKYEFAKEKSVLSDWVFDAIAKILNGEVWKKYSSEGISDQIKILGSNTPAAQKALLKCFDDVKTADAIIAHLNADSRSGLSEVEFTDCGLINERRFKCTWENKLFPEYFSEFLFDSELKSVSGYFEFLLKSVLFAMNKTQSAFNDFLMLAKRNEDEHNLSLPAHILALLPLAGGGAHCPGSVSHLNEDWLSKTGTENPFFIRPLASELFLKEDSLESEANWTLCAETYPKIAVSLLFKNHRLPNLKPILVERLIEVLEKHPEYSLPSILMWGKLEKLNCDLFNHVKKEISAMPEEDFIFWHQVQVKVSPFKLVFPDDINLIKFLAPAIINSWDLSEAYSGRARIGKLEAILDEYNLSKRTLEDILGEKKHDLSIRGSALALRWMLMNENDTDAIDLQVELRYYRELLSPSNFQWFTDSLIKGVLIRFSDEDRDALELLTFILSEDKNTTGKNIAVFELLESWYERSNAPVTTKRLLGAWIGYKFQPPKYI